MGFKASGDKFSIPTDSAVVELIVRRWLAKIVDDMCLQAKTMAEHLDSLQVLFDLCFQSCITLFLDKLEIGDRVIFAGFVVSAEGLKPDPTKLKAITAFPSPTSLTGLRSFLCLTNQLAIWLPDFAHTTVKMRELLKKSLEWLWLPEHEAKFKRVCELSLSTRTSPLSS